MPDETVEIVEELRTLLLVEAGERLLLEAVLVLHDLVRLRAAGLGEGDGEQAPVLLGLGAGDEALGLELGEHLGERCGADARAFEKVALAHLAAVHDERDEDVLLSAPAACVEVQVVTEVAEVMQESPVGRLRERGFLELGFYHVMPFPSK